MGIATQVIPSLPGRFSREFEARKALAQSHRKLNDSLIVGVLECTDRVWAGPPPPGRQEGWGPKTGLLVHSSHLLPETFQVRKRQHKLSSLLRQSLPEELEHFVSDVVGDKHVV